LTLFFGVALPDGVFRAVAAVFRVADVRVPVFLAADFRRAAAAPEVFLARDGFLAGLMGAGTYHRPRRSRARPRPRARLRPRYLL
jgi:hypothetical protein